MGLILLLLKKKSMHVGRMCIGVFITCAAQQKRWALLLANYTPLWMCCMSKCRYSCTATVLSCRDCVSAFLLGEKGSLWCLIPCTVKHWDCEMKSPHTNHPVLIPYHPSLSYLSAGILSLPLKVNMFFFVHGPQSTFETESISKNAWSSTLETGRRKISLWGRTMLLY